MDITLRMPKLIADGMADVLDRASRDPRTLGIADCLALGEFRDMLRAARPIIERPPLTRRQALVLEYVQQYVATYGYAPSLREICGQFGLRSLSSAHEIVGNLVEKGYLKRGEPMAERNISLATL